MEKSKEVHTTLTEDEVDEINDNLSFISGFVEMVMALYSSDQLDVLNPAEIITNGNEAFNRYKCNDLQSVLRDALRDKLNVGVANNPNQQK